jgi:V8-like Glu-specific endopeptidase
MKEADANFSIAMKSFTISLLAVGLTAIPTLHAADYPQAMREPRARQTPFNLVGQLSYIRGRSRYVGSGTVIGKNSVLTAGHMLFSPDSGWARELVFRRSVYGATALSEQKATRIFLLGGYHDAASKYGRTSIRAFARDMGGLRFAAPVASGAKARWTTDTSLLTKSNASKISVGFASEAPYSGRLPTYVSPWKGFSRTSDAFYENTSVYFAGGMSGGPTFCRNSAGRAFVTGVIVSGTKKPEVSGGIRALDSSAAQFITAYLW